MIGQCYLCMLACTDLQTHTILCVHLAQHFLSVTVVFTSSQPTLSPPSTALPCVFYVRSFLVSGMQIHFQFFVYRPAVKFRFFCVSFQCWQEVNKSNWIDNSTWVTYCFTAKPTTSVVFQNVLINNNLPNNIPSKKQFDGWLFINSFADICI